jgi:hypothetical protein
MWRSNNKPPWHTHHGSNIFRIILTITLLVLIAFAVYAMQLFGNFMSVFILPALFGIVSIRYPKISLYDDRFEIVKKCLINRFTDRDTFRYEEVKSITFSPGTTDWIELIILAFSGRGSLGGDSKVATPDQMVITTNNKGKHIFLRFGSRNGFVKTIELIKEKI